jgi:hypothetical protein
MISGRDIYTGEVCCVVGACAASGASIVAWACTADNMQHRPDPAPTPPLRPANATVYHPNGAWGGWGTGRGPEHDPGVLGAQVEKLRAQGEI